MVKIKSVSGDVFVEQSKIFKKSGSPKVSVKVKKSLEKVKYQKPKKSEKGTKTPASSLQKSLKPKKSEKVAKTSTPSLEKALKLKKREKVTKTPTPSSEKALKQEKSKTVTKTPTPSLQKVIKPKKSEKFIITPTPSLQKALKVKKSEKVTKTPTPSSEKALKQEKSKTVTKTPTPSLQKALKPKKGKKVTKATTPFPEKALKHKNNKKLTKIPTPSSQQALNIVDIQKQYGIESGDIKKAVKGVIKFHSENPKLQNQLFQERVPLFLQVSTHQIPRGHSKIIRIPLPNSILTPDDEICLIVPEVKGIKNIEHEKHVEHYEELLRKKGVENIKKIMTCHELRTEYETFEQKSRLADLYEYFLVDGRISGRVVKKCGKIFYKKRKVPTAVKLQVTKLKEHIDKALSKVYLHMHLKGDSYMVQFGHNKMEIDDLVENVLGIIDGINKEFPGGLENIKGIQVYMARATSIPVFMSLKNPTEINVPQILVKRPKAYKTYKGELSTRLNSEVTVRPRGDIIVKAIEVEKATKKHKLNETSEVLKKKKKRNISEGSNAISGESLGETVNETVTTKKVKKTTKRVERKLKTINIGDKVKKTKLKKKV